MLIGPDIDNVVTSPHQAVTRLTKIGDNNMLPAKRINGQNWLPDFFNDFLDGNIMSRFSTGAPAMNVIEDEKSYKLEVAAPGMCRKDVDIHVTKDNKLVIEMEKKCEDKECCPEEKKDGKEQTEKECKNRKYLRREFSYTKSRQTLALPDTADRDKIEASVKHGVLHITIPKLHNDKIAAETKVIEVK